MRRQRWCVHLALEQVESKCPPSLYPDPQKLKSWVGLLATLSKWSMLDVFIIAVLVLALEGSLITAASLGAGISLFAGSVLLSGWAYRQLMCLLIRRIEEESQ